MNLAIRPAEPSDIPELTTLIARSARGLGCSHYTSAQIEAALGSAWGVDTQLIADRTYFVVCEGDEIVACGGWSRRKALFGADSLTISESQPLDPACDAARLRAFFVRPDRARRGLGQKLLVRCEAEARAAGFESAELVATLPGRAFYATHGYIARAPFEHPLPGGLTITFVPMRKGRL